MLKPASGIEQQHDHFGKVHRVACVRHRELFELVDHQRLLAHPRRVDQPDHAVLVQLGIVPDPVDCDRIAGDPGLGSGQQPVFAQERIDQRRFTGVGPPDDGELERGAIERFFVFLVDLLGDKFIALALALVKQGQQRLEQVAQSFAVLGRERDRIAEAERVAFIQPVIARAALGLVGDQHHRDRAFAQVPPDFLVHRGEPGAGIDHEQRDVRADQRSLGLCAHPPRQGRAVLIFPPGGIDQREIEPEQRRIAHPPVTRDPGLIVDQRQLLADQPVPQRRFAHVGTADNDDLRERHGRQLGADALFCKRCEKSLIRC